MFYVLILSQQSVSFLNEKNGVSLPSIRKWILDKYPDAKEKQKATFNNLTIKVYRVCSYCTAGRRSIFVHNS